MAKYSYYSVLNRQTHTCAHSASLSHAQEPTGPPTRPGTSILHSRLHIDEKMIRNKTRLKPYHPLLWGLKKKKTRQHQKREAAQRCCEGSGLRSSHSALAPFPIFDSTYVCTQDETWVKPIGPSQEEWQGLFMRAVPTPIASRHSFSTVHPWHWHKAPINDELKQIISLCIKVILAFGISCLLYSV